MTILLTFLSANSDEGAFSHVPCHHFHSNWSIVGNHHESEGGANSSAEPSQAPLVEVLDGSEVSTGGYEGDDDMSGDVMHGYENPFSGSREAR